MNQMQGRLPLTFHMTFQPERHYLSALLQFAQRHTSISTIEYISEWTGIPTGRSTGKVKPLIQYARGMGILEGGPTSGGGLALSLTPLSEIFILEDYHLLEESTQWALHLMLCRRVGGAEAWHTIFIEAASVLGRRFDVDQLGNFLENRYGSKRDVVGPLFRAYADPAALGRASAIRKDDGQIWLSKAPMQPAVFDTVAALLLVVWDIFMQGDRQISLRELENYSGLMAATGWNVEEKAHFLSDIESRGLFRVDRQTGDPILTRLASTADGLGAMYDRLV